MNEEQKALLDALAARRWRVALALTAVMLVVYFGFILLVAFDKPLMATLVAGERISVGIVLGVLVIVTVPLLTAVYVRWANLRYDPELHALIAARREMPEARALEAPLPMPPRPRAPTVEEARP